MPFETALTVTRAGNLFTTHTPVEAGFDGFSPALVEQRFRHYVRDALHIPMSDFLALGRQNPEDASEPFSMALLCNCPRGPAGGRLYRQAHPLLQRGIRSP